MHFHELLCICAKHEANDGGDCQTSDSAMTQEKNQRCAGRHRSQGNKFDIDQSRLSINSLEIDCKSWRGTDGRQ